MIKRTIEILDGELETLADRTSSFLDKKFYHCSNLDLDPQIKITNEEDFSRLNSNRLNYFLTSFGSMVNATGTYLAGLLFMTGAIGNSVKMVLDGPANYSEQNFTNALLYLGIGIPTILASPFFFKLGKKTLEKGVTLKNKTDTYSSSCRAGEIKQE